MRTHTMILAALGAVFALGMATPAQAERDGWRGHGGRGYGGHHYHHHYHHRHHHYAYPRPRYYRPPVAYAPPRYVPYYAPPPVYYGNPGVSFGFTFR